MKKALGETERRRVKQMAHNELHGIIPTTVKKALRNTFADSHQAAEWAGETADAKDIEKLKMDMMKNLIEQDT